VAILLQRKIVSEGKVAALKLGVAETIPVVQRRDLTARAAWLGSSGEVQRGD
jgi:hypothetical protein